jgi:methyl-accepting chemotaxis protein
MTVAKRMYLLILSAVFGLVLLGAMSIIQMNRVFTSANFANENVVPSLVLLNDAVKSFSQVRVRLYRHVLNKDSSKAGEIETKIKEGQAGVIDALKKYEKLLADDKDKQLLASERRLVEDYGNGLEEVLVHSRALMSDKAITELGKLAIVAEQANDALEAHVAYNVEIANKSADEARATMSSATFTATLVGLCVLAMVVSMVSNRDGKRRVFVHAQ